jgi:hypothetical protein
MTAILTFNVLHYNVAVIITKEIATKQLSLARRNIHLFTTESKTYYY